MKVSNITTVTEFILLGIPFLHGYTVFVVGFLMYLTTIMGNGFILVIVALEARLQTPMYFFLSNLAFLEICYTATVIPKMLQTLVAEQTTICFHCCMAQMYLHFALGSTELFILTAMSFDRYLAICKPLQYHMVMTKHVCLQMSLATWYGAFFILFFPFFIVLTLPFCGPNTIDDFYCDIGPLLSLACTDTRSVEVLGLFSAFTVIVMAFVLTVVPYIFIISTIIRIPSALGRRKAFSTCTSHLIVVSILYGTLIFMYVRPNTQTSPRMSRLLALLNTALTPMLNPFIYTIRNNDVKQAVKSMIQKKRGFPKGF